jgi:hypothetical protein
LGRFRRRKDELPGYGFRYLGPFDYVSHDPDREGPSRFMLRRSDANLPLEPAPGGTKRTRSSAPPAHAAYQRYVTGYELEITPKHHELQKQFETWLAAAGADAIVSDKACVDLRFKLVERGTVLAEIKPCNDEDVRFAVRTALGQLLDYSQDVPGAPARLIVLGTKPTAQRDVSLATINGFGVAFPSANGFEIVWP